VIAPERNEQDVEEIPEHLRKDLSFRFVGSAEEALEIALQRRPARRRARPLRVA
jgi:ATP-dependent Lon protease